MGICANPAGYRAKDNTGIRQFVPECITSDTLASLTEKVCDVPHTYKFRFHFNERNTNAFSSARGIPNISLYIHVVFLLMVLKRLVILW